MYKISVLNGSAETVIHYPNPDVGVPHVIQAPYILKLSQASNVTPRIGPENPGFNIIYPRKTLIHVTDTRDNEIVYRGRALYPQKKMDGSGEHYIDWVCEDELGYLNDTNMRTWNIQSLDVYDFISQLISKHNALTTSDKQFTLGNVEISGTVTYQCNFETPLALLTDQCVNKLGGQLQVRTENGIRYLDYLTTIGQTHVNSVKLGQNMLDMALEQNNVDKFGTRIIPIGKDNLTIVSVNNNLDYIQDDNAVNQFGVIELVVQYKDIDDAATLFSTAKADLSNYTQVLNKFECSAADLNKLDPTIESFGLGDDIPFTNPIFGMNAEIYSISEIDGDFTTPYDMKLTFANRLGRMTERMQEVQATSTLVQSLLSNNNQIASYFLDGTINALKNKIVASGAYQHATVLEDGGTLYENTDSTSPDYGAIYIGPGIISIASAKDSSGNWKWTAFGTGAGFTADLIVAGTMLANRIKGGQLSSIDGSLTVDLENGHFTLRASDTGNIGLDFINRSIDFYSLITANKKIGTVQTEMSADATQDIVNIGLAQGTNFSISIGGIDVFTINKDSNGNYSISTSLPLYPNNILNVYKAGNGSVTKNGTIDLGNGHSITVESGLIVGWN